jgi:hypothetical protein
MGGPSGGAVRLSDPNDAWRIGAMCFDAERAGQLANVWHNSALFYGVTCHCAVCHNRPENVLNRIARL